ncbi:hypothetical protein JTB14_025218 [Gonioctena quinquepunctata]|nr:hypothetical protein JTB14_025218 [Gonioctena quinquepunctata]
MTACLKKDAEIEHTPKFIDSFGTCKEILTNGPLLQYPDFSRPFNLTTDASNLAIGAILSQWPIGKDKPIAYASRTLTDTEINYSTIGKKMLAIVWATKYFRSYLFGKNFKIMSGHRPLQWLFSLKDANSKLVRWRLKLGEFDYKVVYKKGKANTNADALSRVEINTKEAFSLNKFMNNFNEKLSKPEEDDASMYNNAPQGEPQEIDKDRQNLPQRKTREESSETDTADEEIPNRHDLHQGGKSNHSETDTVDVEGSNQTVYTNHENPTFEIPISDKPINVYKNQVLLQFVNYNPSIPVIEHTFPNKQRIHVQIGLDDIEKSLFNFFKEYISPKSKYALPFLPEEIYQPTCDSLQRTFKNTAKRALINALGSIVKAISGNLDQDDAEKYDSAISTLQRNQYENAPCRNINPGYLCHSNSIQYDTTSIDCIAQILRLSDDAAFCQHVPVTINTTLIEQLTPGHYIAIFPEPTKISTHCSATGIPVLHGTFLIELPTGCGFETPRDAYINSKKVIREQPLTLPIIQTVPVHPKEEIKPIHLEKMPLDELHKLHDIQDPILRAGLRPHPSLDNPGKHRHCSKRGHPLFQVPYHTIPYQKKATTTPPSEPPVLFVPYKTFSGDGEVTK